MNCWPQENPDGCQVNIEYTLQREDLALENVTIAVPLPYGNFNTILHVFPDHPLPLWFPNVKKVIIHMFGREINFSGQFLLLIGKITGKLTKMNMFSAPMQIVLSNSPFLMAMLIISSLFKFNSTLKISLPN